MSYSGQRTRWGTFYRAAKEVERTRGRRSPTAWWTFTPDIFEAEEGGGEGDGVAPIQWGKGKAAGRRFVSTPSERGRANDDSVQCGGAGRGQRRL
jgi:hypothetical protein